MTKQARILAAASRIYAAHRPWDNQIDSNGLMMDAAIEQALRMDSCIAEALNKEQADVAA